MLRLYGINTGFAGTDTNGLFYCKNENLSITDFAGVGGTSNCFHDLVGNGSIHHQFDLDFGDEIDNILGAAINFLVPFLTAVAFDL